MTKLFAGTPHAKFIAAASAFILTIAIATSARGVQLQAGRVTQVVNDVKLRGKEAPRPVALGDLIRHGAPVSTGTQSRSEVTFNDLTITRLGANTTFSFKPGTREMNLIDGAILFQVPKGSGGATIRTAAITAAITGTTGIGEFHPATTSHSQPVSKWLCLEGTFHLYLANGQSVELGPGKMVTTDGESFSKVLTFDIARLVSTSLFFTGFDQPLASMNLIMLESQNQLASSLFANSTSNPLDPTKIVNVTSQAIVAEETQTSPSESPTPPVTPTPSEFGPPSVITSPVPYLITNGTVITTDPSITTNGVTDFGKIYRGPVDDGAFSLWAFGSTSAIDTALDFDTNFENAGHFPLAAFKFTSLVLAGNPTIDLTNGVTNLALISVGDITSGLPGGTLTFSGLDALLLASQDGSINLGSEVTFQGIPTLFFYARGTNGDLTLASPIIGTTDLFLYAGRNITFNAGTDLILGGQFSTRSVGGNISVSESGNIAIGGSFAATSDVIADAANGGNITFATGGSFSASDVVVETTVEPGVTLTDGANITFDIGTSLTVNGGGALTLDVLNNDGGHIGTGGNISVTTGGDLTAGSIDALIDNRNGGTIDSSANLTFNIGGALTTTGDASFGISNNNDGSGGGIIGSDAVINVSAASISAGGALFANIFNIGGSIGGSANLNFNLTGDLTTSGDANFLIDNSSGGTIGGNTAINVNAVNITANSLLAQINNTSGNIGGNANINFNLTGNLQTVGDASFSILNGGGTIGGDSSINVNAASISIGGSLSFTTDVTANTASGGNIAFAATGGSFSASDVVVETSVQPGVTLTDGANITFDIGTSLTVNGGSLSLTINDSNGGTIGTGGNITLNTGANLTVNGGGALTLDVLNNNGGHIGTGGNISVTTGGDLTAGSSDALIDNSNGGTIDSSANLTFNIGGALTTTGDASFGISNSNDGSGGGMIGSDAVINMTANNISIGGALSATIDNFGGGTIGGNATINLAAANITANSLLAQIDNSNGGSIGSGANVTLNVGGDLTTQGDATFQILNFDGGGGPGTIGVDAVINVAANNISIGGGLEAAVINFGGTITGNATVNVTAANIIMGGFDSRIRTDIGASIGGDAAINLTANTLSVGALSSTIENFDGSINGSANINFNLTGDLTTQGNAGIGIEGAPGGTIGSNATVNVTANNISTGGNLSAIINQAGSTIGLDAAVNVSAASILTVGTLNAEINSAFGTIGGSANVNFNLTGDLTTGGDAAFQIANGSGAGSGTIGSNATVNVTANNLSTGGNLGFTIDNPFAATIVGSANLSFNLSGDLTTGGDANFTIDNSFGSNIGGNTTINVTAANIVANSLLAQIDDFHGGIGSSANVTLNVGGDLTTVGDATLLIRGEGGIGSDAVINVTAANVSTGTLNAAIDNSSGGTIGGSANVNFNLTGDLTTGGDAAFQIANSSGGVGTTIGSHAMINVTANNVSTGTLNAAIDNSSGGTIGGMALLFSDLSGDLTTTSGDASFRIDNANRNGFGGSSINGSAIINIGVGGNISAQGTGLFEISNDTGGFGHGGGTIGSDALISVGAANISTGGPLSATIENFNENSDGSINGTAIIQILVDGNISAQGTGLFAISNDDGGSGHGGGTINSDALISVGAANISTGGPLSATIENFGGGTIGGSATINVTAANITANSLLAQIDNTAGSIFGNAAINMNVSGSATVPNDATVAISGNDPAGSAAININGTYDVGGTFLSRIDGNGTLTFNNATAHADVLKAGVFGANGALNINGGMLSADTTLKLYAPGSNGQLNFMSNVTLGGNSLKILAANSVTITNNVVVTIGGPNPADVFTNNANYTGFGGNGTTTGTFAGAGANGPEPLNLVPPFGPASPAPIPTRTRIHPRPPSTVRTGVINVSSSDELLTLLDDVHPGRDGRISIPASKSTSNSRNSNRVDAARLNAASRLNPDRRATDRRTASSSSVMRRLQ